MSRHIAELMGAIAEGVADRRLRAEHFVHLRCELSAHDLIEHFETYSGYEQVRLASLMDHTPGQRQWKAFGLYHDFYQNRSGRSDEEMQRFIAARLEDQERYAASNRQAVVARGHELGLTLASHDDTTPEHVDEARRDGVRIAEFPTTMDAARAAGEAGLSVLMGAPNVVRGGSHSGNVSASELAAEGLVNVLSSDYVPFSLMQAAFGLPDRVESISLPQAIATVTKTPAEAAGFEDRGEIAAGKRADLARVAVRGGVPIVKSVWRDGVRII